MSKKNTKSNNKRIAKASDNVTLEYNLYSLPTAQHKAGLAGLIVLINTMKKRKMQNVPEIKELTTTGCKIEFNKESMQNLFDDFFDAIWVEEERNRKLKRKDNTIIRPKRIEKKIIRNKNGKEKEKEVFIYDKFVPAGNFLKCLFPKNSDGWIELWRDMLWNTLRGIPKTRKVYEERADGKKSSVAKDIWQQLCEDNLKTEISSSLYIGAQSVNAENVPFIGIVKDNFLLYFWSIVSFIFQPRIFTEKGKYENKGYVLVIPEPANLKYFILDIEGIFGAVNNEMVGTRPKDSIIDLPEEGGLKYLLTLVKNKVSKKALSINAVEIKHLEKQGNNIKILQELKITPHKININDYENIIKECKNYFYKTRRINNLLNGTVWFNGFDRVFSDWPMKFFIFIQGETPYSSDNSDSMVFFGEEIFKRFNKIEKLMKGGQKMEKDDELSIKVYKLIREYVNQRIAKKNGLSDIPEDIYSVKYREDREHICSDAFLAMRSRREKDFVEYFTGTICSVPQFMPEEDFLLISKTLMEDWEKIKILSMLAISACSYTSSKSKEKEGGN